MHVVGFILRIYYDAWSPERQTVTVLTSVRIHGTDRETIFTVYASLIYRNQNRLFFMCFSLCRVTRLLANQKPISNWSNLEKDPTQPFSKVIASKCREFN